MWLVERLELRRLSPHVEILYFYKCDFSQSFVLSCSKHLDLSIENRPIFKISG